MDWGQAMTAGELALLERELAEAGKEAKAAFSRLRQSKLDGTWTPRVSEDYWLGSFRRYMDLQAQVMGLTPIKEATLRGLVGLKEGEV